MSYRILAVPFLFFLANCASSPMQAYVGEDIQAVIADRGEPIDIVERENGERTYVFSGDEHWMAPDRSADSSNIEIERGYDANRQCTLRFNASWSEQEKSWMVDSYRHPDLRTC